MDELIKSQEAKPAQYETPRVVASMDALDLITDADGVGVGGRPWGSVTHDRNHWPFW